MIRPAVLGLADTYRDRFQTATPFRHLCVEDFLEPEFVAQALADFPVFDTRKAINEFGEVGGKAVVEDIAAISPFYKAFHDYICSPEFLNAMSAITGIEGLQADPTLYGGGTHDNRHGQQLDPHIDFNYDPRSRRHRRLNLLIYLNPEWELAWGGDIELHSDPRKPYANQIKSFAPTYNRAVLFETNEQSWHGFPIINLPDDRRDLSRKCISIYFYTDSRPEEEIAPPHGTHYIPRPLPPEIKTAGRTLSEHDVHHIHRIEAERDGWIAFYQRQELQMSREIEDLRVQLAAKPPPPPPPMVADHLADLARRTARCLGIRRS